jgi:hypothetical protein
VKLKLVPQSRAHTQRYQLFIFPTSYLTPAESHKNPHPIEKPACSQLVLRNTRVKGAGELFGSDDQVPMVQGWYYHSVVSSCFSWLIPRPGGFRGRSDKQSLPCARKSAVNSHSHMVALLIQSFTSSNPSSHTPTATTTTF